MSRDALVIGINTYRHQALNTLKAVPAKDAEAIAQMLETYGKFRVRRLPEYFDGYDEARRVSYHAEVTVRDLRTAIQQLFYPEGDHVPETALLYFSGHGLRQPWGKKQKGYLATSDVDPEQEQLGFELTWLQDILEDSPIKQQIVWLDCCHSGELLSSSGIFANLTSKSSLAVNESLQDINPGLEGDYDRCLITASRGFELAFQQVDNDHGVLTAALLKGLDPKRRSDGWVTNITLADFIKQSLSQEVQCPLFLNYGKPIVLTTAAAQKARDNTEAERCPYKGLAYFDLEDAELFHGRTALIDRLISKVENQNFLAVIGASGSGKSSVVRAGLLYELKLGQKLSGSDRWQYNYKPFVPGEQPFKKLKQLLGTRSNNLAKVIQKNNHERVVLFIDQFEECFTLCQSDKERHQFFDCLLDTLEQTAGKLCLIIAIRADFLGKCAEYPRLANKIRAEESLELVTPMNETELREAIVEPARIVSLEVEPLLIDRMIEDVEGYPGSLPLLQFTLTELWKTRKEPYLSSLMLSAYNTIKGVKGALEKVANEVYESLSDKQKIVARRIFLELIQPGEETEDTRRRVLQESLINEQQPKALVDDVVKKLSDKRLITTSLLDPQNPSSPVILDVVHESLIRHWRALRGWIKENRDAMRVERKLEGRAKDWASHNRSEDLALRGSELEEAQEYYDKYLELGQLDAIAQEFVQFSRDVRTRFEQEKEDQLEKEREKNAALEKALIESNLREQAMTVQNLLQSQPVESLILAIKITSLSAEKLQGEVLSPVLDSLHWALSYVREENRLSGHGSAIRAVSVSPDGRKFISCSIDGTLCLWDLKGNLIGQPFRSLEDDYITSVAFHPDGKKIISAHYAHLNRHTDSDGSEDLRPNLNVTLCLWNLKGEPIGKPFQGHEDEITSVTFSLDGKWIISSSFDHTLRLWDLEGNPIGKPFCGHEAPVTAAVFSSDGQMVISGSRDGTLRLWNLQGQQVGKPFRCRREGMITSVAIDSSGQWIANGIGDGTVYLWSLQKRRLKVSFQAHSESISSIAFSSNGQRLITGSDDSTIRLWDLDGKRIGRPLKGHEGSITAVSFDSDTELVISGSVDQTIRLWSLHDNAQQQETFCSHNDGINAVAFSPDSQKIISASEDKTIGLWSLQGNLIAPLFRGHEDAVNAVAFHPSGELIISASADQQLRLWNLQGKMIGEPFQGHEDTVNAVAFHPSGELIISASADQQLRLWNLQGKMIGEPFQGHEDAVNAVAFHPSGELIISAGHDGALKLWDLEGNLITQSFQSHVGPVTSVAFSPDGQLIASGGADRAIRLSDLKGNEVSLPFQGHGGWVSAVTFSADGKQIISGSADYTLKQWDLKSNPIGPPLQGHEDRVSSVAISSDKRWIASGSYDATVRLWNSSNWEICLEIACKRLHNHSLVKAVMTDPASPVCRICQKYWLDHYEV